MDANTSRALLAGVRRAVAPLQKASDEFAAQLRSALVEAIDGSLQVWGRPPSAYPQPSHTSTHIYLTPHLPRCRTSSPSSTAPSPPPAVSA